MRRRLRLELAGAAVIIAVVGAIVYLRSGRHQISPAAELILATLVAVYLILGMLYESLIHPITIISTLPSAGLGALLTLALFSMPLVVIGIIGIIFLIGIVFIVSTARRIAAGAGSQSTPVAPLVALLATGLDLSGCAVQGAPAFPLFGAYFPSWMFCGAIGMVAAIVARAFFEASGLADVLPFQLYVCASIGVCAALGAGFAWFGP